MTVSYPLYLPHQHLEDLQSVFHLPGDSEILVLLQAPHGKIVVSACFDELACQRPHHCLGHFVTTLVSLLVLVSVLTRTLQENHVFAMLIPLVEEVVTRTQAEIRKRRNAVEEVSFPGLVVNQQLLRV